MKLELEVSDDERSLLFYVLGAGTAGVDPRLRSRIVDLVNKFSVAFREAELRVAYDFLKDKPPQ